jgi:hypothetical protein
MTARGLLLAAILCGALAAADSREVTGRVVDAQSGQPIARAHVTVNFFQGGPQVVPVALLSDADGSFRIANVPEGAFNVSCEKAGYLPAGQGMPASSGGKPVPLVIRLTAQAAIEGTVIDDGDLPAENTFIQLVRQEVVNGRRQYQPAQGGGTDETGYFRIFGLPAGRYYVGITAHVNGARRRKSLAYPQIFYPNATELAAAQPFDLKPGDEQQIKIRLPEPVPAREISGTVATADANVGLMLTRQTGSSFQAPGNVNTNWDAKTGTFRIAGVTPGIYVLTASVHHGRNSQQASTIVTVGNADITGVRLDPADIGLDGTVRVEGDTGQQRPVMYVALPGQRGGGNGAGVDPDGKFRVDNLAADSYRVVPQINGPQCVRAILQDGRDVRDGIVIGAESAPAPVEIVVSSHCGSVAASMAPSDSVFPQDLMLALLRKAGTELVLEKQGYLNGAVSSSAYLLQGITPGDYMLYAWPRDAQIEYANPEYMRQFESYGKAVTVTEDNKVSVALEKVMPNPAKD